MSVHAYTNVPCVILLLFHCMYYSEPGHTVCHVSFRIDLLLLLCMLISSGLLSHQTVNIVCICCPFLFAIFFMCTCFVTPHLVLLLFHFRFLLSASWITSYLAKCVVYDYVESSHWTANPHCEFPAVNVAIIRDKWHLILGILLFDDDNDDINWTLSSNSSSLDMSPHIVTVNVLLLLLLPVSVVIFPYFTFLFTILFFSSFPIRSQTLIYHLSGKVSSKFSS